MKIEYAMTQVASTSFYREEIEEIIRDNLLSRGGEPSYDFASHHPIFVWDDRGGVTVRWVQQAVFAKDSEQWRQLRPMPSRKEFDLLVEERRKAIAAKQPA